MDYSINYTLLAKSKVSKLRLNDETVNFWYMHFTAQKKKHLIFDTFSSSFFSYEVFK